MRPRARWWVSSLTAMTLGLGLLASSDAQAQSRRRPSSELELSGDEAGLGVNTCRKWPKNRRFTITIPREAEIEQLINWMMSISCQKFIWSSKLRAGKVTILAPEKVSLTEAYAAFYAALEQQGLTVEPAGDYFKIVETKRAQELTVPLYAPGDTPPNNDRYITQLVRVGNVNPKEVNKLMEKLKSKRGSVQAVGNLLILTDRGSVVRRLMSIVNELDQFGSGEKVFFYQLDNAGVADVAKMIRDVFGDKGTKSKRSKSGPDVEPTFSKIIEDERTNTLIVVSSGTNYETISRLIKKLDVPLPGGGGRIRVRRLKYADPKQVAKVLQQAVQGAARANKKTKGAAPAVYSQDVKISPDEATRSLLISASSAAFKELDKIIDQLDVERRQVYVELYLLETTMNRDTTLGASAHGGMLFNKDGGIEEQALGVIRSTPTSTMNTMSVTGAAGLTGLTAGLFGAAIPSSGQIMGTATDLPAFGVLLAALERSGDANVVAQPHMPIADNVEGTFEIGRRVPTPGAVSFGGGAGGNGGLSLVPMRSINREDVTLRIKLVPHINSDDTVSLDVEIEDKDILGQDPDLGVTTSKRSLKSKTLLARDGQPMVLGGHVRESERVSVQEVPGIGKIPIIGWLFKNRTAQKEKTLLLYVLVPHILESPEDMRRITEQRRRERQEFIERMATFEFKKIDTGVNYRNKRGMLATIDQVGRKLEQSERWLREAEAEMAREPVSGELGGSPRETGSTPEPAKEQSKVISAEPIAGDAPLPFARTAPTRR